jgi:HEAT repeat protein
VIIEHLPDEAFPLVRDAVLKSLNDEDDDVCIAAADYLARQGDEEIRETLIETYLNAESRPRVRGRILDLFCEHEWPVKGYRKRVEEAIVEPFYLTAKGTVKRRMLPRRE